MDVLTHDRDRIRSLNASIASICTFFLTGVFVVVSLVKDDSSEQNPEIIAALVGVMVCLVIAIFLGVYVSNLPHREDVIKKSDLVKTMAAAYEKEYRQARRAIAFMIVGVILFCVSIVFHMLRWL